jgi:hypothetical protein
MSWEGNRDGSWEGNRDGSWEVIAAKRGGTREQCSQKLFELAKIFWKIIKISIHYV